MRVEERGESGVEALPVAHRPEDVGARPGAPAQPLEVEELRVLRLEVAGRRDGRVGAAPANRSRGSTAPRCPSRLA
ncbi:MAG TPA: hypothetical protein VGB87_03955, partial [Vicinamibacteria bacterium]